MSEFSARDDTLSTRVFPSPTSKPAILLACVSQAFVTFSFLPAIPSQEPGFLQRLLVVERKADRRCPIFLGY